MSSRPDGTRSGSGCSRCCRCRERLPTSRWRFFPNCSAVAPRSAPRAACARPWIRAGSCAVTRTRRVSPATSRAGSATRRNSCAMSATRRRSVSTARHSPDCMSTTPISCSDSRRRSSARATHPRRAPRSMSSSGTTRIFAHRQGISCTPGRSRRKATYRRRSRSTRCWRPPTPAPKPRCVTRSCCRPRVVVPRRRRWRASCSSRRASRRVTTAGRSVPGWMPPSG